MDWIDTIKSIFGSGGTFIMLFIAWKTGMLKDILNFKKNGNGVGMEKRMDLLEEHFNHELTESLNRIEKKLDTIVENTIIIKTKLDDK